MIYLVTALYCEAGQLIRKLSLVKKLQETRYQEFFNTDAGIRLVVTGVGEISAAAVLGSVFTKYQPQAWDFLVNLGVCAGSANMQGIYLCSQLKEQATGKTFYPDLLYRHPFQEACLATGMVLWQGHPGKTAKDSEADCLYDMEAAAVYQAGAFSFGPHQMSFLKIVSDQGDAAAISKKQVETIMEAYEEQIIAYLGQLQEISKSIQMQLQHRMHLQKEMDRLCTDMHCSKSMRDSLKQHMHYMDLAGIDYASHIQALYAAGILPCKDKKEGKKCFGQFCRKIFS